MSGSSGGGGSSGAVSYPGYIEDFHEKLLDDTTADTLSLSMVAAVNAAMAANPYTGMTVYDPSNEIADIDTALTAYDAAVTAFAPQTTWDTLFDIVQTKLEADLYSTTEYNLSADEFRAKLEAQLTSDVLPRFQAGMRDINSVVTSSFVLGQSILEDGIDREVALYLSKLKLSGYESKVINILKVTGDLLGLHTQKIEFQRTVAAITSEIGRVKVLLESEADKMQIDWDMEEAKWDVNLFQNMANVLAGPAGGTAIYDVKDRKPSPWAGALSGAATGAVIGGQIAQGYGAAAGAAVGAVAGYLAA